MHLRLLAVLAVLAALLLASPPAGAKSSYFQGRTAGSLTCTGCTTGTIPAVIGTGAMGDSPLTVSGGNVLDSGTFSATGLISSGTLNLLDTSAAHYVKFGATSSATLTSDRALTIDVVNGARTLKLGANLTLASDPGAVTGALKSDSAGTFAQAASTDLSNTANIPLLNAANLFTSAIQTVQSTTTTSPGWYSQITGDAFPRVRVGLNSVDVASLGMGSGASARDLFLERAGAANLRFGAPDAAAPVGQTLSFQNVVAGTSNAAGALTVFKDSAGTGTGVSGGFAFQVAPAGSTGTAQNTWANALTISSAKVATFAGQIVAASGSSGSPSISLGTTGFYSGVTTGKPVLGGGSIGLGADLALKNSAWIRWATGTSADTATFDINLVRDAAGILAQRDGTNAQAQRTYNTFTDATIGEWAGGSWQDVSNVFVFGTKFNGTGVARNMEFVIGGVNKLDYGVTNAGQWTTPNAITASGINTINDINAGATRSIGFNGRSYFSSPSNGIMMVSNGAATDFGRLQLGGTTASFPAIKRNATGIDFRLADDSAYAPIAAAAATFSGNMIASGLVSAASCAGQPSGEIISTTGTGALVQCP